MNGGTVCARPAFLLFLFAFVSGFPARYLLERSRISDIDGRYKKSEREPGSAAAAHSGLEADIEREGSAAADSLESNRRVTGGITDPGNSVTGTEAFLKELSECPRGAGGRAGKTETPE